MHTSQLDHRHLPVDLQGLFAKQIVGSSDVESSIGTDEERDLFVDNIADWLSDLRGSSSVWAAPRDVLCHGGRYVHGLTLIDQPTVSPRGIANQVFTSSVLDIDPWSLPLNLVVMPSSLSRRGGTHMSIRWTPDDTLWSALASSVQRWASLPTDWDGEDGIAPPSESIDSAMDFLAKLQHLELPVPRGFVSGDGEIGFRWESSTGFASAAFLPDGHLVAYSSIQGEQPVKIDAAYHKDCAMGSFLKSISKFQ